MSDFTTPTKVEYEFENDPKVSEKIDELIDRVEEERAMQYLPTPFSADTESYTPTPGKTYTGSFTMSLDKELVNSIYGGHGGTLTTPPREEPSFEQLQLGLDNVLESASNYEEECAWCDTTLTFESEETIERDGDWYCDVNCLNAELNP